MTVPRILHGPSFHSGLAHERQKRHHDIICRECATTTVTAHELASVINYDGKIDPWNAAALIDKLIKRAQDDAVAQTLGIK